MFLKVLYAIAIFLPASLFSQFDYAIGYDPSWYPIDLKEKTAPVNAFVNAFFLEMGRKSHLNFCLAKVSDNLIFRELENEKLDAALSFFDPNMVSETVYDFSDPLLLVGPVLVVEANATETSLSEMGGKMVGISPYNDSVVIMQKYPSVLMKSYENMAFALNDLSRGNINGVLMNRLDAEALVHALYSDTLKIVSNPLDHTGIRLFALKGKHKNLIRTFNGTLDEFKQDHTYQNLIDQFNLSY